MSRKEKFQAASDLVEARRSLFLANLKAARARLSPARLKADARDRVVHGLVDAGHNVRRTVQERPVATTAAALALGAYLARRPLAALFHRLYVRLRNGPDAHSISEDDDA